MRGSERLFDGQIISVDRDRLIDVNGVEIVRDVVRHPGGAGGLPLFDDMTVALVRQYRHPARRELLEIPAGRIDPGESPIQCAAREIEQEIGYRPGRIVGLAEFYSTPGFCEERLHVFLASSLSPSEQNLDHDELLEVERMPFDEALSLAYSGRIEDSKTIIALIMADRLIRTENGNSIQY